MTNKIYISILALMAALSCHAQPLSLSLDDCRELALKHNEDIIKSALSEDQAAYDKAIALNAYLPTIDGSATGIFSEDIDMMGTALRMHGAYMAGFTLAQPIFAGGKIIVGNRLAAMGEEAARLQSEKTRMDVIADVDNAYWTLYSVRAKVSMLETYLVRMDALYEQVKAGVEASMATKSDLMRVEAARSDVQYQMLKVRNGEDLCRLALLSETGLDFSTEVILTEDPSGKDAVILEDSIEDRPEYKLLKISVEAARQQVRMAKADYLPTIGIGGSYTWYGNIKALGSTTLPTGDIYNYTQKIDGHIGMAMLSFKIPILDWGTNHREVSKAKLDWKKAELDLNKNARLLSIQLRQAISNLTASDALVESAEKGYLQAEESLSVMRQRYESGLSSLTDLLEAQSQWSSARSNYIEAQTQRKIYQSEYQRALGRLGK